MAVNTISAIERTKFNDEFKVDFEREQSLLMKAVNSNGLQRAGTIFWDVMGQTTNAQERARDGNIPVDKLANSQVQDTPKEFFKKFTVDDFDVFRSNPNYRAMQLRKARAACYRTCDQRIIEIINSTTSTAGTLSLANVGQILKWTTALWQNDVPNDGRVWGMLTPTAMAQFQKIDQFINSRYTNTTGKVDQGSNGYGGQNGYWDWMGVKWFMHTGATGAGTNSATIAIWHEDSICHQIDGDPEVHAYWYEPEHRWETYAVYRDARALGLPRGCIKATFDDTVDLGA